LVLPVLFLVLISIFELGMAFKSYLTVAYLAREGTRLSAFSGRDINADCTTVTSLAAEMGTQDLARLDRIEIFKASPTGTQSASTTNTFRFTGANAQNCTHWTKTINWASTTRQTSVSASGIPALDVIGVRVVLTHRWISQFPPYFGNLTVNENSIVRMEPEAFS
jgi:Flp pilus assembly protein TadG